MVIFIISLSLGHSLPSLYILIGLGIILFLFFSSFVGILSSTAKFLLIPDDEVPEVACHGVARWSTGKYSARGTVHIEQFLVKTVEGWFFAHATLTIPTI